MKKIKTSIIRINKNKQKNTKIFDFVLNNSIASKQITNHVRWHIRQLHFDPDLRKQALLVWNEDHLKRGNTKELTGKNLYATGLYYEILSTPEIFYNENGKELYNFAVKYPKNSFQQLIRREVSSYFAFLSKLKKGQKASIPRYLKGDTFQSLYSETNFKHNYYLKKNGTKPLTLKQLEKLTDGQKNNLYTRIQICPRTNKEEIKLEKGMFFVQALQTDIVDDNTAIIRIIYDENEQNWKNQNKLTQLKQELSLIDSEMKKEKDPKKKESLNRKKQRRINRITQQLSQPQVKRKYKTHHVSHKKQIKKEVITSIDPGVTNLFTLTTVNTKNGDSSSHKIMKKEYDVVFSNLDNKIDETKSLISNYIELKFNEQIKHSRPEQNLSKEEIHKLKFSGWQKQTLRNMNNSEREHLSFLNKELTILWKKRNELMFYFCHHVSSVIVKFVKQQKTSTLVLGKNEKMKSGMKGRNWNSIPHSRIYSLIIYKARANGIKVVLQNEAYSSKLSSLDFDDIFSKEGSGKRDEVNPSKYYIKDGTEMDADVNGAFNILRFFYVGRCKNHILWGTDFMRKVSSQLTQPPVALFLS